jgi:hypothetical protein
VEQESPAHTDLPVSRRLVSGSDLPTAKFVSLGAAALLVFLFALRASPNIAYRLHLPIGVFYALLIGGAVIGLLARRRWARLLPREQRVDIGHLDGRAARRQAITLLAFRNLPILAAIAAIIWFFLMQHNVRWTYAAAGFAIVWNVVSKPLWDAFVVPLLRRN